MISLDSLISRNDEHFLASELGSEMVMMNLESGDYLGLNEVSADIWKALDAPATANGIVNSLSAIYDVSREVCERDVLAFLEKMQEQGMITVQ